jgi:hypothetical protein
MHISIIYFKADFGKNRTKIHHFFTLSVSLKVKYQKNITFDNPETGLVCPD